ncbi:MAG: hypothetical protein WB290_15380 [Smithella sp.]
MITTRWVLETAKDTFHYGQNDRKRKEGKVAEWSKDKEGSSLLTEGSLSGRPDLHSWLRDRHNTLDSLRSKFSRKETTTKVKKEVITLDEKLRAKYEARGIKVSSGTQEEADSLGILIHSVTPPKSPKKEVFMMRAEGQSWEDFKKACIESLKAKGLLAEPDTKE